MKSSALMAFFILAPAGARAWREFLKKPETRAAIAADLDWTLQNDADFVNQFVDRNAAHR